MGHGSCSNPLIFSWLSRYRWPISRYLSLRSIIDSVKLRYLNFGRVYIVPTSARMRNYFTNLPYLSPIRLRSSQSKHKFYWCVFKWIFLFFVWMTHIIRQCDKCNKRVTSWGAGEITWSASTDNWIPTVRGTNRRILLARASCSEQHDNDWVLRTLKNVWK